nr:molybdate-binding protein [Blautia coccoides]
MPIAPSLYSLSNKMDNSLLAVRDINHKHIVVGIGDTKARELLRNPYNGFTIRIGNRLYAHKAKLDVWLKNQVVG